MQNYKIKGDLGHYRLRARRIYEEDLIASAIRCALREKDYVIEIRHGGDVANSYGYPAETECALIVADASGLATCWVSRAPANKITERGAAEKCLSGAGDFFDARCGEARKAACRDWLIAEHHRNWSPLIQLAGCAVAR